MFRTILFSLFILGAATASAKTPVLDIDFGQISTSDKSNTIQRFSINFGTVNVYSTGYADVRLKAGDKDLLVDRIVYAGAHFYARSGCPKVLPAKQSCFTNIRFQPNFEGSHSGYTDFHTNEGKILIDLYGWARRY